VLVLKKYEAQQKRDKGITGDQRRDKSDRSTAECRYVYERFTKNFSDRFMMMVERTHFTVFGNPSDELRGLLDQFGATYLTPFGDLTSGA
jgi:hypothetical protein